MVVLLLHESRCRPGRVERTCTGEKQGPQDEPIPAESLDLGRDLALEGISTRDRDLEDPEPKPGGPDREVIMELVSRENLPERGDARIEQEPPAIGPESVG